MKAGRLFAGVLAALTVVLVIIGIIWPISDTIAVAEGGGTTTVTRNATSPGIAVDNLAHEIGQRAFAKAYAGLGNKAEFDESDFVRDVAGSNLSLRTYATLDGFQSRPLHATDTEALYQLKLRWSTVVGTFTDSKNIRVVKNGDSWVPYWPLVKEARLPPQVIPVNYLRWDVIYRGAEDDWGAQDVEAPHVRIVDMHPIEHGDAVFIMGELLNEDVVPAFVTVKATLIAKNGTPIGTEDSFDEISHLLLPKQVTPFRIEFRNVALADVGSVRMEPNSNLIAASADPIIAIQDQKLNPAPGSASFTGSLVDQGGQIVNVAHVLGTFYDKSGSLLWVADDYIDRALLPQTPASFNIAVPPDIAGKVSSERAVTTTYSSGGVR